MLILITYDVATGDEAGPRRLRRVAKICQDFGQRVQNSVFECSLDPAQFSRLRGRLLQEIDHRTDSLRFYHLGSKWQRKIEHYGAKPSYDPEGLLII
ncbi:MAG TPA: CRISPR-associated endonuclease Cas2 [Solibacterales bacterium]|nr:CRISPR-associated endonuclease Cas2 [Bryobacterales bacterium]